MFAFLLAMSMVSAEESFTFQKNQVFTLDIPMANNNLSDCNDCSCEVSIFYPNGSVMIRKAPGENINSYCKYSNVSEVLGKYGGEMHFNNSVDFGKSSFEFLITTSGNELGTAESIIYIIFLFVLIFIFLLFLYGAVRIPFKNHRTEEGILVSINDMKYLKIVCMVFSYLMLMAIFGIMRQITANYLFLSEAYRTFQWLFWFMLSFVYPIIVVSVILMLIMFVESRKIKRALERGVPMR